MRVPSARYPQHFVPIFGEGIENFKCVRVRISRYVQQRRFPQAGIENKPKLTPSSKTKVQPLVSLSPPQLGSRGFVGWPDCTSRAFTSVSTQQPTMAGYEIPVASRPIHCLQYSMRTPFMPLRMMEIRNKDYSHGVKLDVGTIRRYPHAMVGDRMKDA